MKTKQYTESFKRNVLLVLLGILGGVLINNASADDTTIYNTPLGSGTPGAASKLDDANPVMDGMYHAPQYMPGYPTAATLFPRVVDVECTNADNLATGGTGLVCNNYNWSPAMGRGEYLFIRPTVVQPVATPEPKVITIIKEVPVKHGRE